MVVSQMQTGLAGMMMCMMRRRSKRSGHWERCSPTPSVALPRHGSRQARDPQQVDQVVNEAQALLNQVNSLAGSR
jgi:hypothetical protein